VNVPFSWYSKFLHDGSTANGLHVALAVEAVEQRVVLRDVVGQAL